ncbi:MAG: hypothetical protein KDA91_22085, partial [Planctomycetaceae bacterium]|nr:hypothetical protein [Planctomycetaceae bacterium]
MLEFLWPATDRLHGNTTSSSTGKTPDDELIANTAPSTGELLFLCVWHASAETREVWNSVRHRLSEVHFVIVDDDESAAAIPWEMMQAPQTSLPVSYAVASFVRRPFRSTAPASNPSVSSGSCDEVEPLKLLYASLPREPDEINRNPLGSRLLQLANGVSELIQTTSLRPAKVLQLSRQLELSSKDDGHFQILHLELTFTPDSNLNSQRIDETTYEELARIVSARRVPLVLLQVAFDSDGTPIEAVQVYQQLICASRLLFQLGVDRVIGFCADDMPDSVLETLSRIYGAIAEGVCAGVAAGLARTALGDELTQSSVRYLASRIPAVVVYESPDAGGFSARSRGVIPQRSRNAESVVNFCPNGAAQIIGRCVFPMIGRQQTLIAIDRALDSGNVALLHGATGLGKTHLSVEFARWYGLTNGTDNHPVVLFTSFERKTTLPDLLDVIGQDAIVDWYQIAPMREKQARILSVLRLVPLLWVWDAFECVTRDPSSFDLSEHHYSEIEQNELIEFLNAINLDGHSKARILINSRDDHRNSLPEVRQRIQLPQMSQHEAAEFACWISGGSGAAIQKRDQPENTPALAQQRILEVGAGNPQLLRILMAFAARPEHTETASIDTLVSSLMNRRELIEARGVASGPEATLLGTIQAVLHLSFNSAELQLLGLVAIFRRVIHARTLFMMTKYLASTSNPEFGDWTAAKLSFILERCRNLALMDRVTGSWSAMPSIVSLAIQDMAGHKTTVNPEFDAHVAWCRSMGILGHYYYDQFAAGNRSVLIPLSVECSNLQTACRMSVRLQLWSSLIGSMQGLKVLYCDSRRWSEWSRLVTEFQPFFCDDFDRPKSETRRYYGLYIDERIALSSEVEKDPARTISLQQERVEWDRRNVVDAKDCVAS